MDKISNYIGVIMVVIASIVLLCSYVFSWEDNNFVNIGSFVFIITGIITHIAINKTL